MIRNILLGLLVCMAFTARSQQLEILVRDTKKMPLIGATVLMTRVSDSTSIFRITDEIGVAVFDSLSNELYLVNIQYIGYTPLEKAIQVKSAQPRIVYRLEATGMTLDEVVVTARKPLIRQEEDKMIIDPEPLANTSTNSLEILEKSPGVFVDQDGNIYLNSATPAVVHINGREQKMSAQDMATILRSLPPNSIQRIEVLRTPSTKYDAASSGGIVNVVLKKGVRIGRTGSINAGMNQGAYGNQFIGFNLNNSDDKTSYYLNTNYNRRNALETLSSTRFFSMDSTLMQDAATRVPAHQVYVGFGLSRALNEQWELSYDGRINGSMQETTSNNENFIRDGVETVLSENTNLLENNSRMLGVNNDVGLLWRIDSTGSEWDTRLSYNYNRNRLQQDYQSAFFSPFMALIQGDGDTDQERHFVQGQSDLTLRLPLGFKLETGLKSAWQHYASDADYFIQSGNTRMNDPLRTNTFKYTENINAAYAQASKTLAWDVIIKTGVRVEHTYMQGRQRVPSDTTFTINRVDPFPYVYISKSLFRIAGYDLRGYIIYRRTINRPGYESLNPYVKYIDQYLYETGNPGLQPQFTDNYEANISFDEMPIFAIGRNYTNDIFSSVIYQDPQFDNVAVRTLDNVGKSVETYFRIVGALPPGGTYFFVAGAQYNLNEYQGIYENSPLTFTRGSWRFFTFHSLSLSKTTKLTMNGFMVLNGQQQFYTLKTFGQLNVGLNQTFFDKRLNITLNATDILRTMNVQFALDQGQIQSVGERYSDNQRFGVNVRYSFGIKKKEEQRNMLQMDIE
ncbi:MAG: outer membrane beta-barrel protein [Saprospiraceae bacterium]|nr:outer membrane beta-barrel protein [Saprospiraceae bacterium]